MLINNDYSVHNPLNQVYSLGTSLTIPKYNPIGLPLEIDGQPSVGYQDEGYVILSKLHWPIKTIQIWLRYGGRKSSKAL